MKTGCWWETCPRDVDATPEQRAFRNGMGKEAAYDLATRLLEKTYPFGAEVLKLAKKTPKCGIETWWASHIDTSSFDEFVRLGTEVHELMHCLHNQLGTFIPGVDMNKVVYKEQNLPSSWRNSWPTRGEIYSQFSSKLRASHMFKLYFTNSQMGGMGDQRLSGFLTECEAYLQGPPSGSWLNDGVSSSYSCKPEFTGMARRNINIQEGHPYNLAMWQCASALYLKRVKTNYASTWQKMLAGEGKYGDVGRLFLAHHDRFDFLLRLYIDKNKISSDFMEEEIREARSLTKQNANVIEQLRTAL